MPTVNAQTALAEALAEEARLDEGLPVEGDLATVLDEGDED